MSSPSSRCCGRHVRLLVIRHRKRATAAILLLLLTRSCFMAVRRLIDWRQSRLLPPQPDATDAAEPCLIPTTAKPQWNDTLAASPGSLASWSDLGVVRVAAYPGVESRLVRDLVLSAFGGQVRASSLSSSSSSGSFISLEFRCPAKNEAKSAEERRVLLLLRHPLDALLSQFEQSPSDEREWSDWRNDRFLQFLRGWEAHVEYWGNWTCSSNGVLVVRQEDLAEATLGPILTWEILRFLGQSHASYGDLDTLMGFKRHVRCIWSGVVHQDDPTARTFQNATWHTNNNRAKSRKTWLSHDFSLMDLFYRRSAFSNAQFRAAFRTIANLEAKYKERCAQLHWALYRYKDEMKERMDKAF